ncbi:MAG: 3'-5' exonuclease [Clostridia bacterium]|jgi:DNA polymerase III epsilon subunit family exonuclease|nr:3'-5' exonuclease [Clostridia bacterium]
MQKIEEKQSQNKLNNIFVAIDVETTGLSPLINELIEISAIKYEGNRKVATFTTLIKPKANIPYKITKITGITNDMVKNAPYIEEIMPSLIKFIGDNIIVAHNANFDYRFLQNYSKNSFSKNKLIDTVAIGRKLYPKLPNHKLGTIAKHIGIKEDNFHRAEFDCECCAKIYMEYIK